MVMAGLMYMSTLLSKQAPLAEQYAQQSAVLVRLSTF
jgi:hypothetical protein